MLAGCCPRLQRGNIAKKRQIDYVLAKLANKNGNEAL
jgi:hypothetical protein